MMSDVGCMMSDIKKIICKIYLTSEIKHQKSDILNHTSEINIYATKRFIIKGFKKRKS
jgi:hypothetical protein